MPLCSGPCADAYENAVLNQVIKPLGQDVPGDPQALVELRESADTIEGVADDEQRPPIADLLKRLSDRTIHFGKSGSSHNFAYQN